MSANTDAVVYPYQMVHYIVARVRFDTLGIGGTNGVRIGELPRGAVILQPHVIVTAAFNAATTNVLSVGQVGAIQSLIPEGTGGVTEGTTGLQLITPGALAGAPLTADVELRARYTFTGTAPTAGEAIIVIPYIMLNGV